MHDKKKNKHWIYIKKANRKKNTIYMYISFNYIHYKLFEL